MYCTGFKSYPAKNGIQKRDIPGHTFKVGFEPDWNRNDPAIYVTLVAERVANNLKQCVVRRNLFDG